MAEFVPAYNRTRPFEGGYSNHPLDLGGETNWGITVAVARRHGYEGPMKLMPESVAKDIYKECYWDELYLSRFQNQLLACIVYDCAVNCGPGTAGKILQRTMNVLNRQGKLWPDVEVDGDIGPKTLASANMAEAKYPQDFVSLFQILRGAYHVEICEKRMANEEFMLGWLRRLKVKVVE